mmetsp:Transcript_62852/g.123478  ORF Transcript_62852/g.123478 Transcript_62852/m.123478 type:complete len:306 (-) Transcript_62852:65-982(-)
MPAHEPNKSSDGVVGTGSALVETLMGSLSGLAFGLISPLASMPFDVMKTKMQAEPRFAGKGLQEVAATVYATEGAAGFYRGMLPIVLSTGLQKSALFAAYSGSRRWCETSGLPWLVDPLPGTGGLSPSILVGGLAAGTARAAVETPFELAKVRTQTGGSFRVASQGGAVLSLGQLRELYTGATATWARGTVMLTSFFVLCDYSGKAFPDLFAQPLLGGFLKGGVCATLAWGVAWPLEVVKSRVQSVAGKGPRPAGGGGGTLAVLGGLVREGGVLGLYRGFLPGALRSFVANGAGMAVYQFTQSLR